MEIKPKFQPSKYSTLKVKKSIQRKIKAIARKKRAKIEDVTEQFLLSAINNYYGVAQ